MVDYLSYSGRKTYLLCPKQYYSRYVLREKPFVDPRDTLFGLTIGKLTEWFYTKQLWIGDPYRNLLDLIPEAIEEIYKEKRCDYYRHDKFHEYLISELNRYIPGCVDIIKNNKLLAPSSTCEVDLTVERYDKSTDINLKFGGRADFIFQFSSENIWIMDGKAYNDREQYVDVEQVVWYALQFYIKYHKSPSRIGFIYWKFPNDPIQWVEYTDSSLRDCYKQTFDVVNRIKLKLFDPKPSKACKLCPIKEKCEDGQDFIKQMKTENKYVSSSVFDIDFV